MTKTHTHTDTHKHTHRHRETKRPVINVHIALFPDIPRCLFISDFSESSLLLQTHIVLLHHNQYSSIKVMNSPSSVFPCENRFFGIGNPNQSVDTRLRVCQMLREIYYSGPHIFHILLWTNMILHFPPIVKGLFTLGQIGRASCRERV